jgi:polar amino acid transport system substrate-binding protein
MFTNAKKTVVILTVVVSVILSGCGGKSPAPAAANDLLSKILARGTIVVATDSDYAPQSKLIDGVDRATNTKCAPNEFTANQLTGFDVAAALEIAKRLNVEACFVTPQWSQIITGNWDGRWDISVGSMSITPERVNVLYFTQPYYATPAAMFVHNDNTTYSQPSDLSGKRIGVCAGCTYEEYLKGALLTPGTKVDFVVKDAKIVGYDVDTPALEALAEGDGVTLDGVLTAQPTGLQAIKAGKPIKQLGDPLFFEYLAMATDQKSNYNSLSLAVKVSEIVKQMHGDGTLAKLSQEYYGMTYTTAAAQYDLAALGQIP